MWDAEQVNTLCTLRNRDLMYGVLISPFAIQKAQEKALARNLKVAFRVADALTLQELGRTFEKQ